MKPADATGAERLCKHRVAVKNLDCRPRLRIDRVHRLKGRPALGIRSNDRACHWVPHAAVASSARAKPRRYSAALDAARAALLSHAAKIPGAGSYHSDRFEVGFGLDYRADLSACPSCASSEPS